VKQVKRLYQEFKPENYRLQLEPDREKSIFSGRVVIIGRKTGRPSQRITLHQKDLKISSARLFRIDKGQESAIALDRINTHKTYDELRLHSGEKLFPGLYRIEIDFSGRITAPMHGIYPCNFKLGGKDKQLIATQFESHHAREAFPCVDEPEAKATFDLTLISPAGETAIANTPAKSQDEKAGKLVTVFQTTPKMSTYLLAFAFGELGFKEASTAGGTKVRVYATPDKVRLTDFALDTTVRSLDFFERYYGVPYPLPKMDVIGLPDFSAGAMENWGLITFRESVLYVDPDSSSIDTKQIVAMVIGHELAHQWFGNLVTMKWWNDLWLNESFAELMGYRSVDELYPEWDIWQVFVQREVSSALSRDSLPNVQPVQVKVNHPDELGSVFDPSIVYAKGAALINTVRHLIGEEDFRKGLKSYFTEFKYGNTVAADLWRHLEQAGGQNIGEIMEGWLRTPGFPVVEVVYTPGSKTADLMQDRLVIGKTQKAGDPVWQVPLAASARTDEPILRGKSGGLKIVSSSRYPLTLNHDGHSYFVAQYKDSEHLRTILAAVSDGTLSPIDRLLLVQNSLLLERAGRLSTLDNINMLPAYSNELNETVWGMLAGIIGNVRTLIGKDDTLEKKLNGFIRPHAAVLVKHTGWQAGKDETAQKQKLRSLALSLAAGAEDKDVITKGLELFKNFKQPADLSPDIRQAVYYIAVRYGSGDEFRRLKGLYSNVSSSDEQEEIAAELTATRKPEETGQLLEMLKSEVRPQDFLHWFAWLIRNRYAEDQTWKWLTDNWDWVEDKFGSDKSYDSIPRYAASAFTYPTQLQSFKDFFVPRINIALERSLRLGIEDIEGKIIWRQANESSVKDWLKSL
jgi:aminopeptidase N